MYSIGQFAARTGISADTLRYYEKLGLLAPERDSSGRRQYSEADLAWAQFVARLKRIGMPLKEIQAYSTLRAEGDRTLEARRQMLMRYRERLKEQIRDLAGQLARLEDKIAWYSGAIAHRDAAAHSCAGRDRKQGRP